MFTFEQRGSTWTCAYEGSAWPLTLIGRHVYYGTGRILTTLTLARKVEATQKLQTILTGHTDLLIASQRRGFAKEAAIRLQQSSSSSENDLSNAVSAMLDALLERLSASQDEIEVKAASEIPIPVSLAPTYTLWPIVPQSRPGMVVAPSMMGKSAFALLAGISIATGKLLLPRLEPRFAGPVLYIGQEETREQWISRVAMICKGHSIEIPKHLFYLRLKGGSLIDSAELLAEIASGKKAALVIVDSAQATWGSGSDNVREYASRWFNAIDQLEVPTLIIEHPNLEGTRKPGSSLQAAGTSVKRDRAGHQWQLKSIAIPARDGEPYRYHVTLSDVKRNYVAKQDDITYEQLVEGYEWMRFIESTALTASTILDSSSTIDDLIVGRLRYPDEEHPEGWSANDLKNTLSLKSDRDEQRLRMALGAEYWRPASWLTDTKFRFVRVPGTGTDKVYDPILYVLELERNPVQLSFSPGEPSETS